MWTAQIESKKIEKGVLQIGVIYSNGTDSFTVVYPLETPNFEGLKTQVKNRLANLNGLETLATSINVGVMPDPVVVTPTQAELDQAEFLKDYTKWQKVKKAIDVGILTGNEAPVVALLAEVKSEFKPAYLDII